VIDAVRAGGIDAILPVSDITTLTLARALRDGELDCRSCIPPYDTLELAADKRRTLELAQHLNVPVPWTIVIESADDIGADIDLPYPIVIKPARSRVWHGGKWLFNAISYARDAMELRDTLQRFSPAQFPVLLQERIEGPGTGVFACCDHGRLLAMFSHRRIREKPPSGGVSVLREAVPVDPEAGAQARRILEALQWHGPAMVEFKLDRRDDTAKLMEINGRLWGSLQLAIDAGVDFPKMMAQMIAGEPVAPISTYRTGIQSRWFWGDVDSLLALLIKPEERATLPSDHPGRWRTLRNSLVPWYPGLRYEVLSFSDPKPWLYETRRWFTTRS
jgi:predicted ATP-grasp superfamily ATP-dependent carboligase